MRRNCTIIYRNLNHFGGRLVPHFRVATPAKLGMPARVNRSSRVGLFSFLWSKAATMTTFLLVRALTMISKHLSSKRRPLSLIIVFTICSLCLITQLLFSVSLVATCSTRCITVHSPQREHKQEQVPVGYSDHNAWLVLAPGELPGYTGWARPFHTIAGLFEAPVLLGATIAGQNVTVRTHCHVRVPDASNSSVKHPCRRGGSLFFVRAYGRAVLPGQVVDHKNGSYDIVIFPLDSGRYTIEVVLAFSGPQPFRKFPLPSEQRGSPFEGYILPGFPLELEVEESGTGHHPYQVCSSSEEVLEKSTTSALEEGRWKVVERAISPESHSIISNNSGVSLQGYQRGTNSLGVRMDYFPRDCSLIPEEHAVRSLLQCSQRQKLHLIFIGDSNLRMQRDYLVSLLEDSVGPAPKAANTILRNISTTLISTSGGIIQTMPNLTQALNSIQKLIAREDKNTDYFVLFNSGLHDIFQRCIRPTNGALFDSCGEEYRHSLIQLFKVVDQFPARLSVFQTTTAGWPKYGNYGFAWPTAMTQTLPRDPNFVEYFNRILWAVVSDGDFNSFVMDGYWLTLARPDHRQVSRDQFIGKHLVHSGPEVLSVLMRKWLTVIIETSCADSPSS